MERKRYMDLIRAASVCAVILLHTVSGILMQYEQNMTEAQILVYTCIKAICMFCVPCFVMISGALMLNPGKEITLKKLFCKYLRRIVLALSIFGTIYAAGEIFITKRSFGIADLGSAFYNMLTGNSWAHMWYLYMLIGLYLMIPFLSIFVKHANRSVYRYCLWVLLIASSLLPWLAERFGIVPGIQMPLISVYLFYFLLGNYIEYYIEPGGKKIQIILAEIVLIVLILISHWLKWDWVRDYGSPIIVLYSVNTCLLFKLLKVKSLFWEKLNPYIFGIYLVHALFLNLFYKVFRITPLIWGGYFLIPIFMLATFVLSWASVWCMRKVPWLRKYIL